MFRITKNTGFVFLTVPSPLTQEITIDWGYPKEEHVHYRIYGKDFVDMLKRYLPTAWIISKAEIDDVTKSEDIVFFLSHSKAGMEMILELLKEAVIIQEGNG